MNISIRSSQDLVTPSFEGYVRRRLSHALDRFRATVHGVTCRIFDVNGPRGGVDKRCTVVVGLKSGGAVKVEASEADAYRAVDTLARVLKNSLARRKSKGRRP